MYVVWDGGGWLMCVNDVLVVMEGKCVLEFLCVMFW